MTLSGSCGAKYPQPVFVTIGTTLGMLAADGLAVFLAKVSPSGFPPLSCLLPLLSLF
jgi:putative Ca2+/H+ antiporter (TMEM165/GDT1 family)